MDFSSLRKSPVRLLISTVNVETAEIEVFDSYADDIMVDHVLASGSLPAAFPWTTVQGNIIGMPASSAIHLWKW